ncbi:MAG: glycosyltransferase family 2 protein [Bacteroidales bacterium]|jgi:glycosyltransferase involved in cell wall biosynthesis|nr:glycosyltransferase family 2 protein [Bacteroidales bacterium]
MLSILIPIYNYNAVALVRSLHAQAVKLAIDFEILLLDDASDNTQSREENAVLKELSHTVLYELPTKAGRSIARNFLAGHAQYDYLLFLDCDSEPLDEEFIKRYIPYCNGDSVVVCGGTAYKQMLPPRNSYLRWVYGTRAETTSAQERNKRPNSRFSTFNFLIAKKLFWSIRFNELLKNYGHEDTLFGLELRKRNCVIQHIDNPLYHTGIDTNDVYLEKTKQGVKNLKILLENYPDHDLLVNDIRLLRVYTKIEKLNLTPVFYVVYLGFKKIILLNLNSRFPSLFLFNLYKLNYLCYLKYNDSDDL